MRFEQKADGVRIGICEQNRCSVVCELVASDGVLRGAHRCARPRPVTPSIKATAPASVTSRVIDCRHGRQLSEGVDENEPFNVEFAGCDDRRANSKVKRRKVCRRDGGGSRRAGYPHAVDLLFVIVQFVLGNLVQYFDAVQTLGCGDEASGPVYAVSSPSTKADNRNLHCNSPLQQPIQPMLPVLRCLDVDQCKQPLEMCLGGRIIAHPALFSQIVSLSSPKRELPLPTSTSAKAAIRLRHPSLVLSTGSAICALTTRIASSLWERSASSMSLLLCPPDNQE